MTLEELARHLQGTVITEADASGIQINAVAGVDAAGPADVMYLPSARP